MAATVNKNEKIQGIELSLNFNIIQKNKKDTNKIINRNIFIPANIPMDTDNPLPPLNFKKTDQLCPIIKKTEIKINSSKKIISREVGTKPLISTSTNKIRVQQGL